MTLDLTTWPWLTALGGIDVRPLDLDRDIDVLFPWVTHPRSHFWGTQGWTSQEVAREFRSIDANPDHDAWIIECDREPIALTETYAPERSPLAGWYAQLDGDIGMHVLVAPPDRPRSGTTDVVMAAVMRWCFRDPSTARVVVEPDVRNEPIHAKNAAAGFTPLHPVELPDKTALLSVATRADFEESALAARLFPPQTHEESA